MPSSCLLCLKFWLPTSECFVILQKYDFRAHVGFVQGQLSYNKELSNSFVNQELHFFLSLTTVISTLPCLIFTSLRINWLPFEKNIFVYNLCIQILMAEYFVDVNLLFFCFANLFTVANFLMDFELAHGSYHLWESWSK